jgi:hypothetical protein
MTRGRCARNVTPSAREPSPGDALYLRLLGSGPHTGFYEIELPALQPGSSIMPGKVNPAMTEMLTAIT